MRKIFCVFVAFTMMSCMSAYAREYYAGGSSSPYRVLSTRQAVQNRSILNSIPLTNTSTRYVPRYSMYNNYGGGYITSVNYVSVNKKKKKKKHTHNHNNPNHNHAPAFL